MKNPVNQTFLYKDGESKIFSDFELDDALADGWCDNPSVDIFPYPETEDLPPPYKQYNVESLRNELERRTGNKLSDEKKKEVIAALNSLDESYQLNSLDE